MANPAYLGIEPSLRGPTGALSLMRLSVPHRCGVPSAPSRCQTGRVSAAQSTFLVASAVHAGFQLTVTALVYPALSRVREQDWHGEHERHSRRIVPLVGIVYVFLAGSTIWLLAVDRGGWAWGGAVSAFLVAAVTAFSAAPLHGKLTDRDPEFIRRLLIVDRSRAGLALVLLGCAIGVVAV